MDVHSITCPLTVADTSKIKFLINPSLNDSTISLAGKTYQDAKGVNYLGSITIHPYESAVLIETGTSANPPTVSMSGNQTITVSSTSVYATATWASGHTGAYQWTKTSGIGSITSPTSSSTGLTGLSGTSVFRCTVTQDDGQTAFGEVTITVTATNISPTANAGTDQTIQLPTNSVTLSGTGADTDGTITSYSWSKVSGGSATITNASSATTTITGLTQGTYVFQLQVTDNQGATGIDQITIIVKPADIPPTANAGSDQTITTRSVYLSGSGTDSDGSITGYSWSEVSGGSYLINDPTIFNPTISGLSEGTYIFRLTVTDNQGATGSDDVQVKVLVPLIITSGHTFNLNLPTILINK